MAMTHKHLCVLACLAIGGCVQSNHVKKVNHCAGDTKLAWSASVQSGDLTFTAASTRADGELFWILNIHNNRKDQVIITSVPDYYEGRLVYKAKAVEGSFVGGMRTRLIVSETPIHHHPPQFTPYDVRILRPRESVIAWFSLGSEPDATALEALTLSYIECRGNGFPKASFSGRITIPWIPMSKEYHGRVP